MSNIRQQLAQAQDAPVRRPEHTDQLVDESSGTGVNSPVVEKPIKSKDLCETSKLKAKVHQLAMINQQLQDDNYRMKRMNISQSLREQQLALEREFALEVETEKKFDWNTLTFPKE